MLLKNKKRQNKTKTLKLNVCLICFYIVFLLGKGGNMRKKVKGKLYFLAKDAKLRMRNYNREKSVFEQIPYAKACFGVYEQELYERVCKLLDRDEIIINPIQELIDYKHYNTLSLDAKQKYIFDLSEKYKEMKNRYNKEHERFANVSNI